jgi:FtsH-binding integral membrane protein
MSDFDRNAVAGRYGQTVGREEAALIDQGLRAYMLHIYNYMVLGLAITGFAALGIYMLSITNDAAAAGKVMRGGAEVAAQIRSGVFLTPLGAALYLSPLKWVVILSPLAFVLVLSFGIERMRPAMSQMLFWAFAAVMGASIAMLFMVYTQTSVARVFFITAASFGALSLYGYTTKRDLSGMGSFLIMGLFGLIIASLVNLWLGSSMMQFIISVIGVLIFAGLTAYDTQRLKSEYVYGATDGETMERSAIMGALSLYLNFINLFQFLMSLLGTREE